jgi:hypothetical protein
MASVYALRLFIRAMHNRVGPEVELARDLRWRDGARARAARRVILFRALPQLALHRSEGSVKTAVSRRRRSISPVRGHFFTGGARRAPPVADARANRIGRAP